MDKRTKVFIGLSIFITVLSIALGLTFFYKSIARLGETWVELWSSLKYYFCEICGIEHTIHAGVTDNSEILEWGEVLPKTEDGFKLKTAIYLKLFFDGGNFKSFGTAVGMGVGGFTRWLVLLLPLILLMIMLVKKAYSTPNANHNQDSKPLKAFKWIANKTYQPIKRFVLDYLDYIRENGKWKISWIVIWLINLNVASIIVAFVAYYLYFAVTFKVTTLYGQFCNLILDLELVSRHAHA